MITSCDRGIDRYKLISHDRAAQRSSNEPFQDGGRNRRERIDEGVTESDNEIVGY